METGLHIVILSNVIMDPCFSSLIGSYFGEKAHVIYVPFGEHTDENHRKKLKSADLIVVWLNLEYLSPRLYYSHEVLGLDEILVLCKKLYADVLNISHAKILWFSFENYSFPFSAAVGHIYRDFSDRLNATLKETLGNCVSFIDLEYLIAEVGIYNAYDSKGKYRWNAPYSKILIDKAVREIHKQHLIEKGISKKCLILDCDNVLWGGILSEEGIENLKLGCSGFGRVYHDFQRFVLSLHNHGVILAISSKNDLPDVLNIFRNHNEMLLREDNIACFQVNWEDKPTNIKNIAKKLNISLDSIVFVDDSIIEIEAVKALLPDVTTILFNRNIEFNLFSCFNLRSTVCMTDIKKRHEAYQTNELRENLRSQYADYSDYINALGIKLDIHEALSIEYSRISELTQRTNRCTNGKRYSVSEIKKRVACDMVNLYSISVSDRFSDLGLVGAIEITEDVLTLFALSCRALGRQIEKQMIDYILDKHQIREVEFKSTSKNNDLKTLLVESFPDVLLTI